MVGLTTLNLGDRVKPVAIERYKGSKNVKDVISVVSRKIEVAKIHYYQGLGYFYCFDGACCDHCGLPMLRYIIPICHYSGTYGNYGQPVFVKFIWVSPDIYEEDFVLNDELKNDLTKVDILVTCSDEQYQKLKFKPIDGIAMWQSDENIKNYLKAEMANYKRLIGMSVARTIDEEKLLSVVEGGQGGGSLPQRNQGRQYSMPTQSSPPPPQIVSGQPTTTSTEVVASIPESDNGGGEPNDPVTPSDFEFEDLLGE